MGNKRKTILLAVLIVVLLAGAYYLYNQLQAVQEEQVTEEQTQSSGAQQTEEAEATEYEEAQDFTVFDAEGSPVRLSDFAGQYVVLNFWASWCGPCVQEMPHFETAFTEYGKQVQFMMLNLSVAGDDSREDADAFIAEGGYTFPIYYDEQKDASTTYGIMSIPTTYFINKEGNIVSSVVGAMSESTLMDNLEQLMQES
ncbi:MAG: TlpA family protein disulfide reductase [Lachnospiraceae bacterium]